MVTKRRLLTTGAVGVTVAAVSLLAACSGGSQPTATQSIKSGNDVSKFVQTNPQDVSKLDQGGTLTLPVGSLGPNFNFASNAGFNSDTGAIMAVLNPLLVNGIWNTKADGTPVLDKDFATSAKEEIKNGVQKITYELNPKAKYNDGTPFDVKAFQNMWHAYSGKDKDYTVPSTAGYDQIKSVKQGKDSHEVIVTMSKVYEPYQALFGSPGGLGIIPPQVKTAKQFNNAFTNNLHPEWSAGPFTLKKYDQTAQTVQFVPNPKWWGEKPVLSNLIFKQYETTATVAAFKNGEIDATSVSTAARLKQLQSTPNSEIRKGQTLGIFGMQFNAKASGPVSDINVRKAMFQGTDRSALTEIRFKGTGWSEELPGSWLVMPWSPYYHDNYPAKFDVAAAKKTLEDDGWKAGSNGIRSKDGKQLTIKVTKFGDDPTGNATVQKWQSQMKAIGIDMKIDARPSSAFNAFYTKLDYDTVMNVGNGIGTEGTSSLDQYFGKDNTGNITKAGSDEIDKWIKQAPSIVDPQKRADMNNKIEGAFFKFYTMLPYVNGPSFLIVHKGLANYGPSLFQQTDWAKVGWVKGSDHS